jgi:hypothetical protein
MKNRNYLMKQFYTHITSLPFSQESFSAEAPLRALPAVVSGLEDLQSSWFHMTMLTWLSSRGFLFLKIATRVRLSSPKVYLDCIGISRFSVISEFLPDSKFPLNKMGFKGVVTQSLAMTFEK